MLHLTCYRVPSGRKTPALFIKGLHVCNSPMCTLSQNGYGDRHGFGNGRADIVHAPLELTNDDVLKKLFTLLDLCVSSLRRGHANLLCIVPILTDDLRRGSDMVYHCKSEGEWLHTHTHQELM